MKYLIFLLSCLLLLSSCFKEEFYGDERPSDYFLGIMNIDGTGLYYLKNSDGYPLYYDENMNFTPDGHKLTNGTHIMNIDGSGFKKIVPDSLVLRAFCFNNNGDKMYYVCRKSGMNYLFQANLLTNNQVTLCDTLNELSFSYVTISDDEKLLAFPKSNNIFLFNLETNEFTKITKTFNFGEMYFINNDTELLYTYGDNPIRAINIETGNIRSVAPRGTLTIHNQAKTRFVYNINNQCEMLDINGSNYQYSIINSSNVYGDPSISADGFLVMYRQMDNKAVINYLNSIGEKFVSKYGKLSPTGDKILLFAYIRAGNLKKKSIMEEE